MGDRLESAEKRRARRRSSCHKVTAQDHKARAPGRAEDVGDAVAARDNVPVGEEPRDKGAKAKGKAKVAAPVEGRAHRTNGFQRHPQGALSCQVEMALALPEWAR